MQTTVLERSQELQRYAKLQERLVTQFRDVFPDPHAPRTVVVVPSLSLDAEVLAKISGIQHYEERMLCMLMLLRMPRTRVVYVTSVPIDPGIIDYFLHLLPGVPTNHARERLTLLSCHDASPATVAEKILERPRLMQRIRDAIPDLASAHMTCFNATAREQQLAIRLGIPMYACDPALGHLGNKTGSRQAFREAGVRIPDGYEALRDMNDVIDALTELKRHDPGIRRAVVKLDEGTSGEGNAVFSYEDAPAGDGLHRWIRGELPARLQYESGSESWDRYAMKFNAMGGVVEAWVEGAEKRSPSVQCRVDPLGAIHLISTHDQILGGPSGQVFLGSTFPADEAYRLDIQEAGGRVARVLRDRGALSRFAVDFVSVRRNGTWTHYAIEVNLRKGGTTHTYMMLQFLTDGAYDKETGLFRTPAGQPCYYYASDNLKNPNYRRLTPADLIDIAVDHDLHFHSSTQEGVVFHLIGALSEFGKLGVLCVGSSHERARRLYNDTVQILDQEALADGEYCIVG